MALTKEDLQAIAELMDARLDAKLDAKLTSALAPINQRLDNVDARLDNVDARLDNVDARLDKVDARLDTMQADITSMQTRMDRMEDSIDSLKKDMAHHNHRVEPLLNAIKEGIDGLQERNKQVDRLEARVEDHGHRIFALEQVARTTR